MLKNPRRITVGGACIGLADLKNDHQGDLYFTETPQSALGGFFIGGVGPFGIQSFDHSNLENGIHVVSNAKWVFYYR